MMWPAGYATQGVLRRTGRIWNVTKRAVGVEVNKQVRLFTFLQCSNGAVTVLRCPLPTMSRICTLAASSTPNYLSRWT